LEKNYKVKIGKRGRNFTKRGPPQSLGHEVRKLNEEKRTGGRFRTAQKKKCSAGKG